MTEIKRQPTLFKYVCLFIREPVCFRVSVGMSA